MTLNCAVDNLTAIELNNIRIVAKGHDSRVGNIGREYFSRPYDAIFVPSFCSVAEKPVNEKDIFRQQQ
jgi:hypothetical protein